MKRIYSLFQHFLLSKKCNQLGSYGSNCDLQPDIKFSFPKRIFLQDYIYIGPNASLNGLGGISIGNGTIIGPNVFIHSANHRYKNANLLPYDEQQEFKKVVIEDNVWIGGNVSIAPGSFIGEGCIIGMGCVVSGRIPPLSIVIGNPCKIVSQRDRAHYERLKKNQNFYLKAKKNGQVNPDYNTGYENII